MDQNLLWWQKGIIYQIYPRSFMDSNGDGVGDLRGIITKIDYLKWLGVNAVWLSPFYPSPMKDFGYDITDYRGVHPIFGTLGDFDELIQILHEADIKLILDFVPNHTSDQHHWFQESRSSRHSKKRHWYIWQDPKVDGSPPNNWLSSFGGGPAWTFDEKTGQYYYHAFLKEQPDLNWRNPEVQEAMFDNMRFWLDRGVDGFRVDVIWHIVKDEDFRDNPLSPEYQPHQSPHIRFLQKFNTDQPEVHQIIEKMRHVLDKYEERMMVGEVYLPVERLVTYYGSEGKGVHLPFNFHLISVPWNPKRIASVIQEYESSLPEFGWPNWVLGNHDNPRVASRIGERQVGVAALLLLTLRGTPTMYYGDEVGMHNAHIPPEGVQDPFEKNVPGMGYGRDPQRTPMQWSALKNGSFSTGKPWLPLAHDFDIFNVETQKSKPDSILNFYRELINLRQKQPALYEGTYEQLQADDNIFAYFRRKEAVNFLVVLNFRKERQDFESSAMEGKIVLSTRMQRKKERVSGKVVLRENEGLLIQIP